MVFNTKQNEPNKLRCIVLHRETVEGWGVLVGLYQKVFHVQKVLEHSVAGRRQRELCCESSQKITV